MIRTILIGTAFLPLPCAAQSLSPMTETITTVGDTAALRLTIGNPAGRRMAVALSAHHLDWSSLAGVEASRGSVRLGPDDAAEVLVRVPLDGAEARDFRICVTSVPFPTAQTSQAMRGQVCGRYSARRRRP